MKILINQVGYQTGSFARAVLQGETGESLPDKVVLRHTDGKLLADFPCDEYQIVEGWKDRGFRTVEFPAVEGGPFTLEAVSTDGHIVVSPQFRMGHLIEAKSIISDLLFGITVSRSIGASDDADRRVPFFGDRKGFVDVHGGWYDASGDTSKYLSHLSYANYMNPQQTPLVVWTLLDSLDRLAAGEFPMEERLENRFREEAAWGADFLMRMQDPEGYFYMTVFDTWSKDLDERKICAYKTQNGILSDEYQAGYRQGGGLTIAALARASRLNSKASKATEDKPGDYSVKEYLDAAIKGWRHLEEHNLKYLDDGKENIIDDTCALIASCELVAAGFEEAREAATRRLYSLVARWNNDKECFRADENGRWSWFHASDEALPVIALIRALETEIPGDDGIEAVKNVISMALVAELNRSAAVENPFGHPRHCVRMPGQEDHAQFFFPHENPSGYWWQGENARLASWAAATRRFLSEYEVTDKNSNRIYFQLNGFADDQVNWILGLNPFEACMLQGHGQNNPPYEWDHFNVPGGVANGITSGFTDEDDIAFMPAEAAGSGDHVWRWGEQWMPHAAWLLLAAAWTRIPPV